MFKDTKQGQTSSVKSGELLTDFTKFCYEHPELRFWQALYAWTGRTITVSEEDPFYWEGKDK